MRYPTAILSSLIVLLSANLVAQKVGGGGGKGGGAAPSAPVSRGGTTGLNSGTLFLSGKVIIQDGTPLAEPVAIESLCNGLRHTEGYTDMKGNFSLQFASQTSSVMQSGIADATSSIRNGTSADGSTRDFRSCQITAALPGFSSELVDLGAKYSGMLSTDVGKLVLRRMGGAQGTTISAISAAAPGSAVKAYQKGREDQVKQKWDTAQKHFEDAVRVYPQYAQAWFEMGRTQVLENNLTTAKDSFETAQRADPKFISPYLALAELAARDDKWSEVVKHTDAALALNRTDFPQFWFLNAIANYDLHNLAAAEKSAREGLKFDTAHTMPKIEYLLGLILSQQRQYSEAVDHMQRYLSMVHTKAEIDDAQHQLARLARLSASASAQPPQPAAAAEAK